MHRAQWAVKGGSGFRIAAVVHLWVPWVSRWSWGKKCGPTAVSIPPVAASQTHTCTTTSFIRVTASRHACSPLPPPFWHARSPSRRWWCLWAACWALACPLHPSGACPAPHPPSTLSRAHSTRYFGACGAAVLNHGAGLLLQRAFGVHLIVQGVGMGAVGCCWRRCCQGLHLPVISDGVSGRPVLQDWPLFSHLYCAQLHCR